MIPIALCHIYTIITCSLTSKRLSYRTTLIGFHNQLRRQSEHIRMQALLYHTFTETYVPATQMKAPSMIVETASRVPTGRRLIALIPPLRWYMS
jgi:hypothetical protein